MKQAMIVARQVGMPPVGIEASNTEGRRSIGSAAAPLLTPPPPGPPQVVAPALVPVPEFGLSAPPPMRDHSCMEVTVIKSDSKWAVQTPVGRIVVATEDEAHKLARQIRAKWQLTDGK